MINRAATDIFERIAFVCTTVLQSLATSYLTKLTSEAYGPEAFVHVQLRLVCCVFGGRPRSYFL
jgi:hypothetical protein